MAKSGDRSYTPRPAISKDQLVQPVSTTGWRNDLIAIALISWTFVLRVPSERPPSRRQQAGEDLLSGDRLNARAAIGLSDGRLTIKLSRRKHMAGVAIKLIIKY